MFALNILLIVALMAGMSVFITKITVRTMGKLGGEAMYKLHQSAEFIHNTGLVPPFWQEAGQKKLKMAVQKHLPERSMKRIEARLKKRYEQQLIKIIRFAERSSTIVDEETRAILVASLKKTLASWRTMSLHEITGSRSA